MKKGNVFIFICAFFIAIFSYYELAVKANLTVNIIAGKETDVYLNTFASNLILTQEKAEISVNGELNRQYNVDTSKNLNFFSEKEGKYKFFVNILGVIPSGSITVNVIPETKIYAGGDAIGIRLKTKGVIVVGFEEIGETDSGAICPAKISGVKLGDVITHINGINVNTADEFRNTLREQQGEEIELTLVRKDNDQSIRVKPVKDIRQGSYFVGLWVRDNIAGIGTLTCISADLSRYAALGHSISDVTTGIKVPISDGELVKADILSVIRGQSNKPGEIKAVIDSEGGVYGNVDVNNDFGIYGDYYRDLPSECALYEFAMQDEIELGPAKIISAVDGEKKEYDIEITKIVHQNERNTKSMMIKVVDEELLEKTGGIVQGMSGSPIIQNSKIIGAITHVLLNDPGTGYAIFIEWMIKDMYSRQNSTEFLFNV